jgi:hypothetical protein
VFRSTAGAVRDQVGVRLKTLRRVDARRRSGRSRSCRGSRLERVPAWGPAARQTRPTARSRAGRTSDRRSVRVVDRVGRCLRAGRHRWEHREHAVRVHERRRSVRVVEQRSDGGPRVVSRPRRGCRRTRAAEAGSIRAGLDRPRPTRRPRSWRCRRWTPLSPIRTGVGSPRLCIAPWFARHRNGCGTSPAVKVDVPTTANVLLMDVAALRARQRADVDDAPGPPDGRRAPVRSPCVTSRRRRRRRSGRWRRWEAPPSVPRSITRYAAARPGAPARGSRRGREDGQGRAQSPTSVVFTPGRTRLGPATAR